MNSIPCHKPDERTWISDAHPSRAVRATLSDLFALYENGARVGMAYQDGAADWLEWKPLESIRHFTVGETLHPIVAKS